MFSFLCCWSHHTRIAFLKLFWQIDAFFDFFKITSTIVVSIETLSNHIINLVSRICVLYPQQLQIGRYSLYVILLYVFKRMLLSYDQTINNRFLINCRLFPCKYICLRLFLRWNLPFIIFN